VRIASSGPEALEVARDHRPAFILLDIGLPGMDGYQVAATLRQEGFGRDVVIIAISGYGQEEDRRRSREAGFDHHLVKPADLGTLQPLITTIQAAGFDRRA
jgi:CheY-like chemotaxis protein